MSNYLLPTMLAPIHSPTFRHRNVHLTKKLKPVPMTPTILDEYKSNYGLYNDFSIAVHNLLLSLLKKGTYKYHVSHRVKDVKSLSDKIERKRKLGVRYRHLKDIEDIAGIRIVFYTEGDRKRFIKKMIKEFGGWIELKETSGSSGYRATHAIATFDEKRTELTEYARFKGLKCEIQLTLILNHAWAEVEHDILYKADNKLEHLDQTRFDSLKQRMEKIMSNYLKEASNELESIVREIRKIKITRSSK